MISVVKHGLLLCVVTYVAWLTSQGVWFFLHDTAAPVMVLSETGSGTGAVKSTISRDISRFHLFGKEGIKPVVKTEAPKVAPKTRLKLKLMGVFTAEQPRDSGAIVEEQGRNADYYRVGDTLPGNAVLEEVYSDRILLRRSGQLETLYFEDGKGISNSVNRIAQTPKKKTEPRSSIDSPEQFVEEATRQLAENPDKALRSVGLAPSDDGGYVYQGNNPMLSGLNLKKGDVIRSVNGHTLGDIQKDKALMKTLYEQGSLDVEVVRDGASFYINYPLN